MTGAERVHSACVAAIRVEARMGRARASASPSKKRQAALCSGGLYPTIALSDGVNCIGHAWASWYAYTVGAPDAALGFALVAEAALVGTLRFGFAERLLAQANGDLADLAAFVGLRKRRISVFLCLSVSQSVSLPVSVSLLLA